MKKILLTCTLCLLTIFQLTAQTVIIDDSEIKNRARSNAEPTPSFGIHLFYGGEIDEFNGGLGFGADILILKSDLKPSLYLSFSRAGSYNISEDLGFDVQFEADAVVNTFRAGYGVFGTFVPFASLSTAKLDASISDGFSSISETFESEDPDLGVGFLIRIPFSSNKTAGANLILEYNGATETIGFAIGLGI